MVGSTGVGPLRRAGFNVLTWDSRGFGQSGGTVTVDFKDNEGRDVVSLINWLAGQPDAKLDRAGDPRVGMHGASYAGGIEFVAAAIDKRIDAIAPAIAWHSLLTALYREDTPKSGWGSALYGAGAPTATVEGAISPAGVQTGTLDPHISSALTSGLATGRFSDEDRAWFDARGPADDLPAAPAVNAVNVAIPPPRAPTQAVGEPKLELDYQGTGSATSGRVFAQIVYEQRGVVRGNQVTPVPVTRDGRAHSVTRSLKGGAASIAAGARYRLQVIGGSQVYGPVRDAASIRFSAIRPTLPTASPSGFSGPGGTSGGILPTSRRGGRLRALVDLRGRTKQRVRVRIVARTRGGKVVRDMRSYRTCVRQRARG